MPGIGLPLQNQQVDVRVGVQLAAAVTAHGHQGQIARRQPQFPPGMAQQFVDQCRALAQQFSGVAPVAKIPVQIVRGLAQGLAQRRQQALRIGADRPIGRAFAVRLRGRIHSAQGFSSRRRVKISQPSSVTPRVCSHCAERRPSRVVTVQPSRVLSRV